jgi:molybdate transport system regulatory protein
MKPRVRIRIYFAPDHWIGPGKVELLEGIERTGSLSQAARALGMSYRRAWMLLDAVNSSFATPAAISRTGGEHGGGATLTPLGRRLIRAYRALELKTARAADRMRAALSRPVRSRGKSA